MKARRIACFVLVLLISITISIVFQQIPVQAQTRYRGVVLGSSTSQDIADLAVWKANIVRYQIHFTGSTDDRTTYKSLLPQKLAALDQVVQACKTKGLKVVVDLHTPPGGFSVSESPQVHRLFTEKWAQEAFKDVWKEIATRYRNEPTIWGYDLLNEPGRRGVAPGLKDWNQLAQQVVNIIRDAKDSRHVVIIEPLYGDPTRISGLKPILDPRAVYSIHMYYPLGFTHQGVYAQYPLDKSYPTSSLNKDKLKSHLQRTIDFQKKNKAQIYVGEFSATRSAPGESAYNYLKDVIDIFEKNSWNWTYHAFRESDVWSVEKDQDGVEKRINTPQATRRAKLLESYFSRN